MIPIVIDTLKGLYDVEGETSINDKIILMGYCYGSMLALKHLATKKDYKSESYKAVLNISRPINYNKIINHFRLFLHIMNRTHNMYNYHLFIFQLYQCNYNKLSVKDACMKFTNEYNNYYLSIVAIASSLVSFHYHQSLKVGVTHEDIVNLNSTQQIYFLNGTDPTDKDNKGILERAKCFAQGNREEALEGLNKNYEAYTQEQLKSLFDQHKNVTVIPQVQYLQYANAEEKEKLYGNPRRGFIQTDSELILKILQHIIEPDLAEKQPTKVTETTVHQPHKKEKAA